ncbi:MAG: DNA repair protein RecO [Thermogutta sp.]
MGAEQATAFVLRVYDFSESSLIVTLFTRELGKLRALAKGAKKPKNPFDFALDLLSLCRIVFLRKSSDALHLLTEAKLVRRFRLEQSGLPGWYAALYASELVNLTTHDEDAQPAIFDLLSDAINRFQSAASLKEDVLRFEWRLLELIGHNPSLDTCVSCGEEVKGSADLRGEDVTEETKSRSELFFALTEGGVLCPRCRPGKRAVLSVRADTIAALRSLGANGPRELPISLRSYGELRALLNQYICHLLGQRPRMHDYLR